MRVERQKDASCSPAQEVEVELSDQRGRSRLSLRQIFSGLRGPGARLRGQRSCSLEHLIPQTSQTRPTSSLKSFSLGAPLAQLRKSSSIQSLTSGQKKSNRSAAYSPASPASW
ncbi:unnamed protein product [Merluccius merluccius]